MNSIEQEMAAFVLNLVGAFFIAKRIEHRFRDYFSKRGLNRMKTNMSMFVAIMFTTVMLAIPFRFIDKLKDTFINQQEVGIKNTLIEIIFLIIIQIISYIILRGIIYGMENI